MVSSSSPPFAARYLSAAGREAVARWLTRCPPAFPGRRIHLEGSCGVPVPTVDTPDATDKKPSTGPCDLGVNRNSALTTLRRVRDRLLVLEKIVTEPWPDYLDGPPHPSLRYSLLR